MRSLLFAPASRPDMAAKLPRSGPDAVVLDLEDAVAPAAKADARRHARHIAAQLTAEHPRLRVYVRVNAVPTEWFTDDVAEGCGPELAGIIVPKLESAAQAELAIAALDRRGLRHVSVLAGIETVAGVVNAAEVLGHERVTACYFGAEDYTADLGGVRRADNLEVRWPRSRVAALARLHGAWAFDQVVTALNDRDAFTADASLGRALGYRGKLCIHPTQVAWANEAFSPSADELDRARRLLAAYDEAVTNGRAAIAFEGQMIDEPLAQRARALIAAALPSE